MNSTDSAGTPLNVFISCRNLADEMPVVRTLLALAGLRAMGLIGTVVLHPEVSPGVERRLMLEIEALPWQAGSSFKVIRQRQLSDMPLPKGLAYITWLEPGEVWYADTAARLIRSLTAATGVATGELLCVKTLSLHSYDYAYSKLAMGPAMTLDSELRRQIETFGPVCFIARANLIDVFPPELDESRGPGFPGKAHTLGLLQARLGLQPLSVIGGACGEFEVRVSNIRELEPVTS